MFGICREVKKYMKTKDFRWYAGGKYGPRHNNYKETYYVDVEHTESVTIKPPSGSFFGNIDGKTHAGNMHFGNDGSFFGNIDGKTHAGWMPLPKQKFTTRRTERRVKTHYLRRIRNSIIRKKLNKNMYNIQLERAANIGQHFIDELNASIKCYGFNEGVEKFTENNISREYDERRKREQEESLRKLEAKAQIETAKRNERKAAEKASYEKYKKEKEAKLAKIRAEQAKRKANFKPTHAPTEEDLKKFKHIITTYPFIGMTVDLYDAVDQISGFVARVKCKDDTLMVLHWDEISVRGEAGKVADDMGRKYNMKRNSDKYKKPGTGKVNVMDIDISHVQRSMGIDGSNDDDDIPDIF
jgi:hypothetical protein